MPFLYAVKNCHACSERGKCKRKNDSSILRMTPKKFDISNRALKRHAGVMGVPPVLTVESFCAKFKPEGQVKDE